MAGRILVINPNSTEACTSAIDRACEPLRAAGGPEIECVTLAEGPPGIECAEHGHAVVEPMLRMARARANSVSAFVVACFGDPGVPVLREATGRPVFGIAEAGMLTACSLGERFGMIGLFENSVHRQRRQVRALGLDGRYAGSRAAGLGVVALGEAPDALDRLKAAGTRLREEDGADVVVMGCAGMADYRESLSDYLGLPVVEPSQAAVTLALGTVMRGW